MATFDSAQPADFRTLRDFAILNDPATTYAVAPTTFNAFNGDRVVTVWADSIVTDKGLPIEAAITQLGNGSVNAFFIRDFGAPIALSDFRNVIAAAPADDFQSVWAFLLKGNDTVNGSAFDDWLSGFDGNDHVNGFAGDDKLFGGEGNDVLNGGKGKDVLDGGAGTDTASYAEKGKSVEVTLQGASFAAVAVGGKAEDRIKNIENVTGGKANDKLTGDALANVLVGNGGNDILKGKGGNDTLMGGDGNDKLIGGDGTDHLYGGKGNDVLTGGKGTDYFVFNTALDPKTNVDTITDFKPGTDGIFLSKTVFDAFQTLGAMSANHFVTGSKAADSDDYIIYNAKNGKLFYDADGDGTTYGKVLFAEVKAGLAITAGDFSIVA